MAKSKNTPAQSGSKTPPKTDAEKREALRGKIAAAEERQAQRSFADQAKDAADSALGYVRANPLKTVAAVAVSALVIGALTRPGRRAGARAGRKAGALAGVATDAALAYGLSLLDSAGSAASKGQDKLADLGGTVGDKARAWQSAAAKEGSQLSDYLVEAARRSGKRAGKSIDDLRSRLRH
ncbi:MAG TPA: hypothetical protein VFS87_02945 [Qipengyuania sp.]|nr:hypothetical protein [Qipengyuania sp.]